MHSAVDSRLAGFRALWTATPTLSRILYHKTAREYIYEKPSFQGKKMVERQRKSPTYIMSSNINGCIQIFFRAIIKNSFVALKIFGLFNKVVKIDFSLASKSQIVIFEVLKSTADCCKSWCSCGQSLLEACFYKFVVIKPSENIGKNKITLSCR